MRNIKLIVGIVALVAASWGLLRWSAEDPSVRGQDPNVTTEALNTSGLPVAATSGSAPGPDAGAAAGIAPLAVAWRNDEQFIQDAADLQARGMALAEAGESSGSTAALRAYAGELLRAHRAAALDLQSLARGEEWTIPEPDPSRHAAALGELRAAAGEEFDRTFLDMTRAAHQQAIAAFRQAERSASSADLKEWATAQREAFEAHLAKADGLER